MARVVSSARVISSVFGVVLFGLTSGVGSASASGPLVRSEPKTIDAGSKTPETGEVRVGDTLEATRDVSLDEAVLVAGSRVSVSGKHAASGAVVVDVALADGHVVRGVPLGEIQKNFRRVRA